MRGRQRHDRRPRIARKPLRDTDADCRMRIDRQPGLAMDPGHQLGGTGLIEPAGIELGPQAGRLPV